LCVTADTLQREWFFDVSGLAKQTRQGKPREEFFFSQYCKALPTPDTADIETDDSILSNQRDEEHMKLFLGVYRLLKAVYSPTGLRESGLGMSLRLQLKWTQTGSSNCVLVTHHHGWL